MSEDAGKLRVSIQKEYLIVCSRCYVRDVYHTKDVYHKFTMKDAEKEFRADGWHIVGGLWVCGECQEDTPDDQ